MRKPKQNSKSWQSAESIRQYANRDHIIAPSNIYTVKIRSLAVSHHRYCECECNGCTREKLPSETWKEYDLARESQMKWVEGQKSRVEALIQKYAQYLGLKAVFSGDPRGCTVRLYNAKDLEAISPIWKEHLEDTRYGHGVNVW